MENTNPIPTHPSQPAVQAPQPAKPSSHSKVSKLIFIILGVTLLVLVSEGGYYLYLSKSKDIKTNTTNTGNTGSNEEISEINTQEIEIDEFEGVPFILPGLKQDPSVRMQIGLTDGDGRNWLFDVPEEMDVYVYENQGSSTPFLKEKVFNHNDFLDILRDINSISWMKFNPEVNLLKIYGY